MNLDGLQWLIDFASPALIVYILSGIFIQRSKAKNIVTSEPSGGSYSSYEEWRRAAVNPEVPVDEVAARTPEGFFEKHQKLAPPEKPELQPHDFATPQYGPASGANVANQPEAVSHGGLDISSVVIRIQPPNGIVGIHNRFFRPDELRATYGPGRYIIRVRYLNLDQESVINWEVS